MASISVTSINVNVNNFQQASTNVGLGPIPAGTTVPQVVQNLNNSMLSILISPAQWPASFAPAVTFQSDNAIMGPWSDNVAGSAPQCVVQAITEDFTNWELPVDNTVITNMAKEITQQISNKGGNGGYFYGLNQVAGSTTIYWGVGFQTAVVDDSTSETGIIYQWTACI